MEDRAKRFLQYVQKSLADAARLSPKFNQDLVVDVTFDEIESGKIGDHARKKLFALAQKASSFTKKEANGDEHYWPMSVVILPRVYGLRPDHGARDTYLPSTIAPLMLMAKLGRDGALSPETAIDLPAIIARDLLEPNRRGIVIGSVEEADAAYAMQEEAATTWQDQMRRGVEILEKVSGVAYDDFQIERYEEK